MEHQEKPIEERIIDALKTVYDPEIPVNIYELGLIYKVEVNPEGEAHVLMTLTAPNCPAAESLPLEVEEKTREVEGVKAAKVEITFEPVWEKEMMSEAAQLELGFM